AARRAATDSSSFLANLQLRIEVRAPTGTELVRVSQLSQRTNQMNSTQLRLASETAVADWLAGDGQWILATWVSDRFGDYGLVCCAFCADLAEAVV
ncbi:unnamed protein product, partial [Symbiodinium microadriaticum]